MTIWRMRIACWIPKATNTHLEYVTLTALPLQQCLHERSSILRYTHIACLYFHQQQYTHPGFQPNFTISEFNIHWMTKKLPQNRLLVFKQPKHISKTRNSECSTGWTIRIPAEIEDFFFPESFVPPLGLPILLFNRVKRPGRQFDHTPPVNTEVKNEWSQTSPPLLT